VNFTGKVKVGKGVIDFDGMIEIDEIIAFEGATKVDKRMASIC
jgi:hypothetical protein